MRLSEHATKKLDLKIARLKELLAALKGLKK